MQRSWTKKNGGYALSDGSAALEKVAGRWILTAGGKTTDLGKKASFDTAEKALGR